MFDIITDSACDLTPETAATLNIEIIPFYVSLDGEHYRKEGHDLDLELFGRVQRQVACAVGNDIKHL